MCAFNVDNMRILQIMRKYIAIPLFVAGVSMSGAAFSEGAHWGYTGEGSPEHWGELDEKNIACSIGKNQSPVDLSGMVDAKLPKLVVGYKSAGGTQILNNGHTIQVNYEPGSTITIDGTDFELKQFHFHTPSENTENGKHYPMEAHFVHADKDGNLAVVALMYKESKENHELAKAFDHMPTEGNSEKVDLPSGVSAKDLLPKNLDYYRFTGSLTTPPCSEGVRWLVLKNPSHASAKQVEEFTHVMHHPNNRPVQPLNARVILK
jgi:carbonic anhydrase